MSLGEKPAMDELLLRVVNKNTAKVVDVERKQENMYASFTGLEKTICTLLERIKHVEREIMIIKKSMEVIREADCL